MRDHGLAVAARQEASKCQQFGTLTARPPRLVSLYFSCMSRPVWRMVSMAASRGTRWVPSPRRLSEAAETALMAPRPLPLDAGDLDEAAHGVAGHAEMVLERDLGGVLDLLGRAAQDGGEARGGHGGGGADLGLAAGLGARDGGVVLDQAAHGGGGQEEVGDVALAGAGTWSSQ
jgi:hypothetical protein